MPEGEGIILVCEPSSKIKQAFKIPDPLAGKHQALRIIAGSSRRFQQRKNDFWLFSCLYTSRVENAYTGGIIYSCEILEYLKQSYNSTAANYTDNAPFGYEGYVVSVGFWCLDDDETLQRVTVKVGHKDKPEPVVTLVGYRADR